MPRKRSAATGPAAVARAVREAWDVLDDVDADVVVGLRGRRATGLPLQLLRGSPYAPGAGWIRW